MILKKGKKGLIERFFMYYPSEYVFYICSEVYIVQLTTFKQAKHKGIFWAAKCFRMQPVATIDGDMMQTTLNGNIVYVEIDILEDFQEGFLII